MGLNYRPARKKSDSRRMKHSCEAWEFYNLLLSLITLYSCFVKGVNKFSSRQSEVCRLLLCNQKTYHRVNVSGYLESLASHSFPFYMFIFYERVAQMRENCSLYVWSRARRANTSGREKIFSGEQKLCATVRLRRAQRLRYSSDTRSGELPHVTEPLSDFIH